MARALSTRPSTLLDVDDRLAAFCLDQAVFQFGSALKNELDSVSEKTARQTERKQESILRKWLPDSPSSRKFADPAALRGK